MSRFDKHPDELLSASLTGEITAPERRDLEGHLAECEECRQTLEAFRVQRELIGGLRQAPVPRDLEARVRGGLESGRGRTWWRQPGGILALGGSLATVAAAVLVAVVFFGNRNVPPTGGSGSPSPTVSASGQTPGPSNGPSASANPTLPIGLQPSDIAYISVTGPIDDRRLTIVNQRTGESVAPQNPSQVGWGIPQRAALSPDGDHLAFAMLLDAKGTWLLYVTRLSDGSTVEIGETLPLAFGDRLLWSPDGRYLAFTVAPPEGAALGASDVWLYDANTSSARQATATGNAIAASWAPISAREETLWVSLGDTQPSSLAVRFAVGAGLHRFDLTGPEVVARKDGAFMPLISPDGGRAVYWTGTLQVTASDWTFARGGMPNLSTVTNGVPTWQGSSLFSDLTVPQGGEAFASGSVAWSADSSAFVFWAGNWTGVPEGEGYPDEQAVYVGRASDPALLTSRSRIDYGVLPQGATLGRVADAALSSDGHTVGITLQLSLPGDLATPMGLLRLVSVPGNDVTDIGSGGLNPPPWSGPTIFVP